MKEQRKFTNSGFSFTRSAGCKYHENEVAGRCITYAMYWRIIKEEQVTKYTPTHWQEDQEREESYMLQSRHIGSLIPFSLT